MTISGSRSKRRATGLLCALIAALGLAAPARAGFTDADYWAFADRQMGGLDDRWREHRRAYVNPTGRLPTRVNAALLLTHAIAAYTGHVGPTRQDARARVLVDRLTRPPAWLGTAPPRAPTHSTCWSLDLDRAQRQHMSLEPKVAEALAWAWRARAALALPAASVQRIARAVNACAHSPSWRYPRRLLNQINWNAEMYASAATVSGSSDLLVNDYRLQLADFAAGITRPMRGMESANLGPGYEFHYRPDHRGSAPSNLDTPEYANIVMHALSHYEQALAAGMRPLPGRSLRRLRAWMLRLLAGSWTHAGYLNWDTSRGRKRWHSGQYWAFAQQGLQTIATAPRFWRRPEIGGWAKSMFDSGLGLYRRLAGESGGVFAPRLMFGIHTRMKNIDVFRARILASAARAVGLGMGSLPASEPPPLWAFDYDTGRLAVTTPRYSTAIVPDDRGAFGYGGLEPARLFGAGQRIAAGTGGGPPGAFGIVVSDARGHALLASQRPRAGLRLHVTRSPLGNLAHARAYPARPYAGPFSTLVARGAVARRGVRIDSRHTFRRAVIGNRWGVRCRRACGVRAYFPTPARTRIEAVLRNGDRVRLRAATRRRVELGQVDRVDLGGYRLVRLAGPPDATLFAVPVRGEPTNPHPGPSLAIEVPARGGARLRAAIEL